jgi:hypothetical protein
MQMLVKEGYGFTLIREGTPLDALQPLEMCIVPYERINGKGLLMNFARFKRRLSAVILTVVLLPVALEAQIMQAAMTLKTPLPLRSPVLPIQHWQFRSRLPSRLWALASLIGPD